MKKQEFMYTKVEEWKLTNTTAKEFCEINELDYHQFLYWRTKLQQTDDPSEGGSFIPVSTQNDNLQTTIAIEYANGTTIHIPQGSDINLIRSLIQL